MNEINRRHALELLALAPLAAGFSWTKREVQEAHRHSRAAQAAQGSATAFQPAFFTSHEYETVRTLVDIIIPSDERSGSATEAGVPEFIDFMMIDKPEGQTAMRGGLAFLDVWCLKRFNKTFLQSSPGERRQLLDQIAYPQQAPPQLSHGVRFFNSFRDLTATGFWTSEMGIEDLDFQGNVFISEWKGCPKEALDKLGVSYEGD